LKYVGAKNNYATLTSKVAAIETANNQAIDSQKRGSFDTDSDDILHSFLALQLLPLFVDIRVLLLLFLLFNLFLLVLF